MSFDSSELSCSGKKLWKKQVCRWNKVSCLHSIVVVCRQRRGEILRLSSAQATKFAIELALELTLLESLGEVMAEKWKNIGGFGRLCTAIVRA